MVLIYNSQHFRFLAATYGVIACMTEIDPGIQARLDIVPQLENWLHAIPASNVDEGGIRAMRMLWRIYFPWVRHCDEDRAHIVNMCERDIRSVFRSMQNRFTNGTQSRTQGTPIAVHVIPNGCYVGEEADDEWRLGCVECQDRSIYFGCWTNRQDGIAHGIGRVAHGYVIGYGWFPEVRLYPARLRNND